MTSAAALLETIRATLDTIPDPCSVAMRDPMSLVEMGLVEDLSIDAAGCVTVTLCLTDTSCVHFAGMTAWIRDALMLLDGVNAVVVNHTLDTIWTDERIRRKA